MVYPLKPRAARTAMMAITTRSSTSVNPGRFLVELEVIFIVWVSFNDCWVETKGKFQHLAIKAFLESTL